MVKVYVIGVGMTKFEKPGSRDNFDYPEMAKEAGQKALADARVSYGQIESAFVGYVYGDSTSGQRAVYELGLTGIPIVNVNNNCSTGSTALYLAKTAIEGGAHECVLALGFEKMQRGSLGSQFADRCNPLEKHVEIMSSLHEISEAPMMAQMFGNAGQDYLAKYKLNSEQERAAFAKIAHKNHKHSVNNPYAQFQQEYTLEQIANSPMIHEPLTKLQCSPTSDGSAAAVLASEAFVLKHGLQERAVEILALEMATDVPASFDAKASDTGLLVGSEMSKLAASKAFSKARLTPDNVQVVELHDCFSANELITYEALGLCAPGKAVEMVNRADNTYGGKYVVNPSGGLISKGHPLGATGLAQCAELSWQLRGEAGKRQVPNVVHALQHNIGLGGACVVGIYRKGFKQEQRQQQQQQQQQSNKTSEVAQSQASVHYTKLKASKFFEEIERRLQGGEGAAFISKINAVIGFDIKSSSGHLLFIVDLKNAPGKVTLSDGKSKPDCTISISDEDLATIVDGKMNMMSAFTQKKLKLSGNMAVAMKLNQVFSKFAPPTRAQVKSKL